jgi:hypothetical protein
MSSNFAPKELDIMGFLKEKHEVRDSLVFGPTRGKIHAVS